MKDNAETTLLLKGDKVNSALLELNNDVKVEVSGNNLVITGKRTTNPMRKIIRLVLFGWYGVPSKINSISDETKIYIPRTKICRINVELLVFMALDVEV